MAEAFQKLWHFLGLARLGEWRKGRTWRLPTPGSSHEAKGPRDLGRPVVCQKGLALQCEGFGNVKRNWGGGGKGLVNGGLS